VKSVLSALQEAGLGMWEGDNGVAAARQAVAGGEVGGKVIEVVSGDTVVVRLQDGKDVRLSLARCGFLSFSEDAMSIPGSESFICDAVLDVQCSWACRGGQGLSVACLYDRAGPKKMEKKMQTISYDKSYDFISYDKSASFSPCRSI
jgi:hypothetical protein